MKRFAYLWFLPLVACATSDDGEYPIHPASPPPINTTTTASQVTGRVCVANDLRSVATCGSGHAGGIIVTSGSFATTTDAAGNFTIDTVGENPTITVAGNGVVPTSSTVSRTSDATGLIVPAIDASVFDEMMTSMGVNPDAGTGSILASVSANGAPVVGATVTTNPVAPFGPFFDGETPVNWGIDGTGQRGVVWVPGLGPGMFELEFSDVLGNTTLVAGVPVRNGGVTILDTSFTTEL
jgi:hypothetical protein